MDTSNGAQREDRDDNFRWHSLIWFIRNRKHPFSNSQILCRIMLTYLQDHNDFRPSCSSGKESAWKCRRHRRLGFDPWVGKIPRVGSGNLPTPVFLPGKSHGQRNLVGYSPWGYTELAITEQLKTYTHRSMRIELGKAVRRLLQKPLERMRWHETEGLL